LCQSKRFFKEYQLTADGVEVKRPTNPFPWRLNEGENKLEVVPVNQFGKVVLASMVVIECGKW
jgi:hypothetical protein